MLKLNSASACSFLISDCVSDVKYFIKLCLPPRDNVEKLSFKGINHSIRNMALVY